MGLYVDGEIVGLVEYVIYDGKLTISNIQVRPEYRRQGYGTRLLENLLKVNDDVTYEPSARTDLGALFFDSLNKAGEPIISGKTIKRKKLNKIGDD